MIYGTIQNFPLTLNKILEHAARWHPDAEVVTAQGGLTKNRTGYAALKDRAVGISSFLEGFGVSQGHHVATLAWNTGDHVSAWYAIMGIGAVCHTLNPRLTAKQLADMIMQSEAKILIASADLQPLATKIASRAECLRHILVIDGEPESTGEDRVTISSLDVSTGNDPKTVSWGKFEETAPCGLCFTSGSTGAPKGVTYTHRGCFLHTLRLLQADVLGLTSADAVLPAVPLFHANAWGLPFAVPAAGAKLVLPGRHLEGKNLAQLISSENVTIAVGVPTVWLGLLEYLNETGEKLPTLRRIVVGGSPMPPALMARLESELGITVQTSWGMTELSPVGTMGVLSNPNRQAAVSGRPALGVDLMLADETGNPLENQRETEGRLYVRGAAVIDRYFGQTATATDTEGWFYTGDLAKIDRQGNLIITGRAKDLIKSGGEWINPTEIEAVVSTLPQVALAAVIGRPDEKWGERPILIVQLNSQISDAELLGPLQGRFPSWWIPDEIIRLSQLPLASTGKINKIELRRMLATPVPEKV